MKKFDFIVAGLGTAGSATCMTLAKRGYNVLGLDKFTPPHTQGSHHGATRSVRRAYLEGSSYVPMAQRAWELWRKLEKDGDQELLVTTGNLTIGPPQCPAVTGVVTSGRKYDIPHLLLTAKEIRYLWPELAVPDTFVGALEKEAGIVFPEKCISAFLAEASKAGAQLVFREELGDWFEKDDGVVVSTTTEDFEAGRILVAAGAWTPQLLRLPQHWLEPKRVPVHWLEVPTGENFALGNFPVNFWQIPHPHFSERFVEWYSLPTVGDDKRVKVAFHNGLSSCDPDHLSRNVTEAEVDEMRTIISQFIPELARRFIHSEICFYTMTADGDFYLGRIPDTRNVYGAALAGHGFKFAPVLGEVLADLLTDEPPSFDLNMFSPERFSGS